MTDAKEKRSTSLSGWQSPVAPNPKSSGTTAGGPAVVRFLSGGYLVGLDPLLDHKMYESEHAVILDGGQGRVQCRRNILVLGDSDTETTISRGQHAEVRVLQLRA